MNGHVAGFGIQLREARERQGVSLRHIANATKISIGALEALERNDISKLPGGIFSRAFVRSYAVEVGLDPEETIREFIAQFPNDSVTAGHPTKRPIEDYEATESNRRVATTVLLLVGLSMPIVLAIFYVMQRDGGPSTTARLLSHEQLTAAPSGEHLPALDPQTTQAATIGTAPTESAATGGSAATPVRVAFATTAPCTVSIAVDGETPVERHVQAGYAELIEVHRELVLRTSNAGALSLTINGAAAKPLGKSGEPATARVNHENFKELLARR
jgi:cytoskeletal protein RodZ